VSDQPATKKDLDELGATLRGEMKNMETRLRDDIARDAKANAEHVLSQMKVLLEPLTDVPSRVDGLEGEAETVGEEIETLDSKLDAHIADDARHVAGAD